MAPLSWDPEPKEQTVKDQTITTPEVANEFTDSDGVVFATEFESVFDRRTIVLTATGRVKDSIEFYASDAERVIELIREAAK